VLSHSSVSVLTCIAACRLLLLLLQDGNMEATGSRFLTRYADGYYQLDGTTGLFVSNRVSDQQAGQGSPFSNAGTHMHP
jgi:hypothetical protein